MNTLDELMDQRRHRRISCQSTARVNIAGTWHSCPINDLSGGGASFRCDTEMEADANVLVQMRGLGVIRARVVRSWEQGFAVAFNPEDYDVGTLVDNLTMMANPGVLTPAAADQTQTAADANSPPATAEPSAEEAPPQSSSGPPPEIAETAAHPAHCAIGDAATAVEPEIAADMDSNSGKKCHPLRAATKGRD